MGGSMFAIIPMTCITVGSKNLIREFVTYMNICNLSLKFLPPVIISFAVNL